MLLSRFRAVGLVLFLSIPSAIPAVHAAADGPDYWDVANVAAGDTLNLRAGQSMRTRVLARIPSDAKGLKNLGCTGVPSFAQWQRMSEAERARRSRARWCRVAYGRQTGWVLGRHLVEGGPPAQAATPTSATDKPVPRQRAADKAFGAWHAHCNPACSLDQLGRGSARPTVLAVEPDSQGNARITFVRGSLPAEGTIEIYMDGERISAGPIGPFIGKDRSRLVLPPDDITLALVTAMRKHRNMVVSFPGEERGVEYRLEQFAEGWQFLEAARRR